MPAAHAPGSVPLSADARLKEANRRKIYLHRLLGDDVSGSKDKGGKSVTWVAALFFAIYVFVASFVIIRRSSVEWRSEVWLGSVTGIYEQPFTLTPIFKYFDDIYTTDDVLDWATRFVWSIVALPGQLPLSLVGFNRLMPAESDEGAIYLTYRRMKLSDSSTDLATTRRFQPLYPNTWLASELKGGTATGDFEDTDLLVSGNFTWRYEPGAGYKRQGGYIAKMVLPTSGGFDKGYVQVNDQRMGFVDFREATWFGPTFGSMAVQMALYNPNYQSISRIDLVFNARETGLLAGKIVDSRSMLLDVYDPITDKADICI
ncbi:unnamed protein product [Prorocentrum cordatum]|uniref:Transmembrane protein 231 n=1 Tax=Prorocentrum cordatum TaxID=2364126 RepID=A0ABN9W5P0_9DINO|nr:unnamed protein product [Polarella glacialis]